MYSLEQDIAQLVHSNFKPRKKRIWPYVTALLIGIPFVLAAVIPGDQTSKAPADPVVEAAWSKCLDVTWALYRAEDNVNNDGKKWDSTLMRQAETWCWKHKETWHPDHHPIFTRDGRRR